MEIPSKPSDLGLVTQDGKDEWRELQQYAIGAITEAFKTKKFVMTNMPTGSGKTIVGAAVARMLDLPSLSLTHTIQLQEQYRNTLPWAGLMTGRSNHLCDLYPKSLGVTAANAVSACKKCPHRHIEGCSYYRMFYTTRNEDEIILNYAYATRILQSEAGFSRKLLICDEADLAEGALVQSTQLLFSPSLWQQLKVDAPPMKSKDFVEWFEWAQDVTDALFIPKKLAVDACDTEHPKTSAVAQLNRIEKALGLLSELIWTVQPETWTFAHGLNQIEPEIIIRPIWGMTVAESRLWKHGELVLLMSATLGDPEILATKLGIKEEDYAYIDFPSTFPVENRINYYWPVVKLNKDSDDADWDTLASAVEFVGSHHLGQKGLIHCGSYKIGKELYKRLGEGSSRYLLQTPDDRMAHLERFIESDEPLVMITPSFSTGLDLPYTIGWQVIAKMPFGNLGDEVVRLRRDTIINGKQFGRKNYDAEAINTVIQACGRAVRAPDDKGTTYILDGNFWNLKKRTFIPQYFKESIRWLEKEKQ